MPALSSTMTEGKIVSWLKSPGDKITKGESVVVVESDKADMDVESFSEGFLGGIVIDEGGVANVGASQIMESQHVMLVLSSRTLRCAEDSSQTALTLPSTTITCKTPLPSQAPQSLPDIPSAACFAHPRLYPTKAGMHAAWCPSCSRTCGS